MSGALAAVQQSYAAVRLTGDFEKQLGEYPAAVCRPDIVPLSNSGWREA